MVVEVVEASFPISGMVVGVGGEARLKWGSGGVVMGLFGGAPGIFNVALGPNTIPVGVHRGPLGVQRRDPCKS